MTFEPRWDRLKPKKMPTAEVQRAAVAKLPKPPAPALQTVRGLVAEMRGRGLSVQQIANVLNGRGVPKPDGLPWTDRGIQSILDSIGRTRHAHPMLDRND